MNIPYNFFKNAEIKNCSLYYYSIPNELIDKVGDAPESGDGSWSTDSFVCSKGRLGTSVDVEDIPSVEYIEFEVDLSSPNLALVST